jgi:site-specific recombinase XerD
MNENNKMGGVIEKVYEDLEKRCYKEGNIKHYKPIYAEFLKCCAENSVEEYTEAIGQLFLEWIEERKPHLKHHTMNEYRMAVRRLDCAFAGCDWKPYVDRDIPYAHSCYDKLVNEYEGYLYRKGKSKQGVRGHVHTIARFLSFAEQQGYTELSALRPQCVFDAFKASSNKTSFRSILSAFLRYIYTYGLINIDLSPIVPSMVKHISVPTVYSPEEVEELLASVERQSELGKRNYAVTLIAARLGLRACDIAAMRFGNLRLDVGTIEIVQEKTKQPLVLPLLKDVESAVLDYIENARPLSDDEHIFLNLRGYGAMSAQSITTNVQRVFDASGIVRKGRAHGSHALRSSLASALLAEGNDYSTIQKVLGHRDIQSTRSYVRAEVEKLRVNALPVPRPAANYEQLLIDVTRAAL